MRRSGAGATNLVNRMPPVCGHVVFGPVGAEHIFASVGYNGSGVVAGHYHGYLLARHLAGDTSDDYRFLCDLPRPRPLRTERERRAYIEQGVGV